jgi:hypothetical protein
MLFNEIKNIKGEEIKKYISVNVTTNFITIKPYIETAEAEYIKKLLGDAQYYELVEYYEDHVEPESHLGDLLKLVQKSLINLAYFRGFPILVAKIGDGGAYRNETDVQKPLFKYQEAELKQMFKTDGFNGLDAVLEYLENNIESFPLFASSQNYTIFKQNFIHTTAQFDDCFPIGGSRIVFLKLRKYMIDAENFHILPVIGKPFFDLLKNELLNNSLSEANIPVVEFLRKAIAGFAISKGILQLGISITDNGIFHQTTTGGQYDHKKDAALDMKESFNISKLARDTADDYMSLLKDFLHTNIQDYPLYSASNAYDSSNKSHIRNNDGKLTFWT